MHLLLDHNQILVDYSYFCRVVLPIQDEIQLTSNSIVLVSAACEVDFEAVAVAFVAAAVVVAVAVAAAQMVVVVVVDYVDYGVAAVDDVDEDVADDVAAGFGNDRAVGADYDSHHVPP